MCILNKRSNRLLKHISKNPVSEKVLTPDKRKVLYDLLKRNYIHCTNPTEGYTDEEPSEGFMYAITLDGKSYLEDVQRDNRRHYITWIISIVFLVVSILTAIFK